MKPKCRDRQDVESDQSTRYEAPLVKDLSSSKVRIQSYAPVAQLDRVLGYEPSGREFESLRARQYKNSPF